MAVAMTFEQVVETVDSVRQSNGEFCLISYADGKL